jgi:aldose 1-epimerase
MSQAQSYSARAAKSEGIDVIHLNDAQRHIEVSIVPSVGNTAYDMKVNGKPMLWSPYSSVAEFKAKPVFLGVPFLSPWANRLDQDAFWANGHKYLLNGNLNNFRRDQFGHPIHGLVSYADSWEVISTGADDRSAWLTSRLEFGRKPEWMAQFPFAHSIEITYRLADGALEVHTKYQNQADEPMPLVIGFHPYFTIPGSERDSWKVHLAARDHVQVSDQLIATGELKPVTSGDPVTLGSTQFDDVFTNLKRDAAGRAEFWAEGGGKKISLIYGPKYTVAVVYAPKGKDFICFEPMTGVTNGFNLAHAGKYPELQSVPARGSWEESFWIRPSGW